MTETDTNGVVVFAPAPSLTITFEQRGDRADVHLHAGGQGFWIARLVAALRVPVTLVGSFGGETGAVLVPLIEREGVTVRRTGMEGANATYVHDRRSGELETVLEAPADSLSRHEVDELYGTTVVEALGRVVERHIALRH